MWMFLVIIIIGIGTVIGYLQEQTKQNKRIIELLEDINRSNQ